MGFSATFIWSIKGWKGPTRRDPFTDRPLLLTVVGWTITVLIVLYG